MLSGQSVQVDPSAARTALAHYATILARTTECTPFPKLGVRPEGG
ncbi:MAG: hypothetical protein AB7G47_14345 [Mycolicibacterium sp.]